MFGKRSKGSNVVKSTKKPSSKKKSSRGLFSSWWDLIKMWDDVYDEYVNRYNTLRTLPSNKVLYMDNNFSYSGNDRVTAYYYIDQLPPVMEFGYRATLRSFASSGVSINFIENNESYTILWDDPAFKSRMDIMAEVSEENQAKAKSTNVYNAHKNERGQQKDERTENSIQYVQEATMSDSNRRELFKVRILMIVTGYRGDDMTNTLRDLELYMDNRTGLEYHRVTGTISSVIRAMSPFTGRLAGKPAEAFRSNFTSDELRARWHPFEQGLMGFGETYLGTNIITNSPVFKQFKRDSTDAEIIIVMGMSGSGKSYLMKGLGIQLVSKPNIVMTINDYEGGEYESFGRLVATSEKVVTLDFSKGSGRYLDPVPLFATGNEEFDNQLRTTAKQNLLDLFRAVAGKSMLDKHDWVSVIIEKGVDKFYLDLGVTEDTSTWNILQDKTIYDVYKSMLGYRPEEESASFDADLLYFKESLDSYFDKNKKVNKYFTKRVTLQDIIDAKLVICNYNMRGVAETSLSELDAILIPLNTSIISFYRTVYPYFQGKYNVKVWEELQRYESLGENSVNIIKTAITGGRKMGDINFVGSNDPTKLLDGKDKFSIFANYNTAIVGKIKSPTIRKAVCRELGIEKLAEELDAIGSVVEPNDGIDAGYEEVHSSPYKKAFVLTMDSGESAVVKLDFPKEISDTKLFKTGVERR